MVGATLAVALAISYMVGSYRVGATLAVALANDFTSFNYQEVFRCLHVSR